MIRRWAALVALLLSMAGCSSAGGGGKSDPPLPAGAPRGLAQATPEQFTRYIPVVNRYLYLRKKAVVTGDVGVLWREYPSLQTGMDRQAAINAEANVVAGYRGLDLIDGNVQPESYARMMVTETGDTAVVLVNGTELYLRKDFGESGGQLQLLLFLERRAEGWTVVKTDETTLAEYHQALR